MGSSGAQSGGDSYDTIFQNGLKAEASQKWADAIQFYMLAMAKSPETPWPKERLKALFKNLQKNSVPIDSYQNLLSQELREEFLRTGIIQSEYDQGAALSRLNLLVWGGVILFFLMVVGGLFYISFRKKADSDSEFTSKNTGSNRKRPNAGSAAQAAKVGDQKPNAPPVAPRKDVKVSAQTRENITGIMSSVKSLSADEDRIQELTGSHRVDVDALEQSGVIQAFAEDLLSSVNIEETQQGKFSKMTVDASLLFDEDEGGEKTK